MDDFVIPLLWASFLYLLTLGPLIALVLTISTCILRWFGDAIKPQSLGKIFATFWATAWVHFVICFATFLAAPIMLDERYGILVFQLLTFLLPVVLLTVIVKPTALQAILSYILLVPMNVFAFLVIAFYSFPAAGLPFYEDPSIFFSR
jgi:hypothetical protein